MRVKDGSHHVASLRDGREVWLHGTRVSDVTTHPALSRRRGERRVALFARTAKPA